MGPEELQLRWMLAKSEFEDVCSYLASSHIKEKPDGEKEEIFKNQSIFTPIRALNT